MRHKWETPMDSRHLRIVNYVLKAKYQDLAHLLVCRFTAVLIFNGPFYASIIQLLPLPS